MTTRMELISRAFRAAEWAETQGHLKTAEAFYEIGLLMYQDESEYDPRPIGPTTRMLGISTAG